MKERIHFEERIWRFNGLKASNEIEAYVGKRPGRLTDCLTGPYNALKVFKSRFLENYFLNGSLGLSSLNNNALLKEKNNKKNN